MENIVSRTILLDVQSEVFLFTRLTLLRERLREEVVAEIQLIQPLRPADIRHLSSEAVAIRVEERQIQQLIHQSIDLQVANLLSLQSEPIEVDSSHGRVFLWCFGAGYAHEFADICSCGRPVGFQALWVDGDAFGEVGQDVPVPNEGLENGCGGHAGQGKSKERKHFERIGYQ